MTVTTSRDGDTITVKIPDSELAEQMAKEQNVVIAQPGGSLMLEETQQQSH